MAIVKKSAARKPTAKKAKGPSPQQQQAMQQAMQQQAAAQQQQAPQGPPQQGAPTPGGQPMMKKGGKIAKKYQTGGPIKPTKPTPKELQNQKDATQMKNMRPIMDKNSPKPPAPSSGNAKCGTKIKKAKGGIKLGKALPPPAKCGAKMKK